MNSSVQNPLRLMVLSTVDATLGTFFEQQLECLATEGFEVHAVSSPGPGLDKLARPSRSRGGSVTTHGLLMQRQPRPLQDLVSLWKLFRLIRSVRPHIVHAHTPKAGLLSMIAARLAGVTVRLYTIHGLPLETRQGLLRSILEMAERTATGLATQVYSVSASLEQQVCDLNLCPATKITTLGDGSCAGLDLQLFHMPTDDQRAEARRRLGIAQDVRVVCYVGRIARDKGIEVLSAAWTSLAAEVPDAHLLLCGPQDDTDPIDASALRTLTDDVRVHMTGYWATGVSAIYAASDICVLPTFREGLGQVALEAAATGLPVVGTRVTGVVNAVRDGVTGILVPARDSKSLAAALRQLLLDPELSRDLGAAGRQFVESRFSSERVNQLWMSEYRRLVHARFETAAVVAETGRS